jgi:uncharacterized short protein YbdD (DUF466 family)
MRWSDLRQTLLKALREWNGDAAYDRYLRHWQQQHGKTLGEALSRKEFFRQQQARKWDGVKRCC